MDNEALVDQIVRSLSFEVVAAPQNVIPVDSTSKTTPVNVKIKVRKKQSAGLRHGVISMPQVDTRSDTRKEEPRGRIRLVSSDHTIMDFDVLMEAEFDKGELENQKKQNLNIIAPDSQEENRTYDELNKSTIFSKRNKDIFGKCKPGGCLDPPFGEDRYPYQSTTKNLTQPLKDDSAKLRNSSIFKNNIFKKKRKSSQDDAQLDKTEPRNKAETDSNLHETGSLTQYSNPLITYPHPSIPKRVQKQDERRLSKEDDKSKRNSSDEKSRTSSIDEGSYYIIPKKTKKSSNQSDTKPDRANITNLKSELEEDYNNVTEIKPAPTKDSKLIPIPLIDPITALTDDIHNTGTLKNKKTITEPVLLSFDDDNHVKDLSRAVGDKNVSLKPKTKSDPAKKEHDSDTDINDSFTQNVAATKKEESSAVFFNSPRDESPDSEKLQSASNDDKVSGSVSKNQIDPQSHPLLPNAREKAVIGITDSFNKVPEGNNTLNIPDQNNIPFSSNNLKEIWENENDPLKSTADVIFRDNIPNVHDDTLNSDQNSTILSAYSDKSLSHDKVAEYVKTEDNLSPKETVYSNDNEPITSVDSSQNPQSPCAADNCQTKPQDNLSNDINDNSSNEYLGNIDNNSQRKPEDNITYYINENPNDDYLTENDQDSNKHVSPDSTHEHSRETKTIAETEFSTDKEEDPTKIILNEPLKSNNSEDDTVTKENIVDLKKVLSVSDLSIMESLHDEDLIKPNHAVKDTLPTTKPQTNTETTSLISFKLNQLPLNEFSDALSRTTDNLHVVQPPSILKKAFWKMDIALQSYIDENNERIIKSFDSNNTPQRQVNDTVLVVQCYLGSDLNEIKIPVDRENYLNVKIAQNTLGPILPIVDSRPDFIDISKKNDITIDTPVSASIIIDSAIQTKVNITDTGTYNDGNLNNDVRNALNRVYEEELLPLQDLIKGLREEIDTLITYQMKFKEVQRVSKPAPKRARPVRQPNKRCACTKKL